jgi:hypothetical protein
VELQLTTILARIEPVHERGIWSGGVATAPSGRYKQTSVFIKSVGEIVDADTRM